MPRDQESGVGIDCDPLPDRRAPGIAAPHGHAGLAGRSEPASFVSFDAVHIEISERAVLEAVGCGGHVDDQPADRVLGGIYRFRRFDDRRAGRRTRRRRTLVWMGAAGACPQYERRMGRSVPQTDLETNGIGRPVGFAGRGVGSAAMDGGTLLRITRRSGKIRVIADPGAALSVSGGAMEPTADGAIEIRADGSAVLEVRCPSGSNLTISTSSGGIEVSGDAGSVKVTTKSGNLAIERAERDQRSRRVGSGRRRFVRGGVPRCLREQQRAHRRGRARRWWPPCRATSRPTRSTTPR